MHKNQLYGNKINCTQLIGWLTTNIFFKYFRMLPSVNGMKYGTTNKQPQTQGRKGNCPQNTYLIRRALINLFQVYPPYKIHKMMRLYS